MKNYKKINKAIIVFSVSLVSFGCSKIADINKSPNNPSLEQATPQVLFPSAVMSTAGKVGGDLEILGGIWAQFFTQSNTANQYKNIDTYNLIRTDFNRSYDELFAGALQDYSLAITQAKAAQQWQYYLMSAAMKAYTYEVLVDLYDQVPYSEAFLGQANIQPKFDDGYTVYKGLLAELDDALSKNYQPKLSIDDSKTDFLFGSKDATSVPSDEMSNWAKFANTLELKMYLRMVNAKPAEAQAGVQKVYSSGLGFLSIDAGVGSNVFVNSPLKDNPFYEQNIRSLNVATNVRASYTLASYLSAAADPRAVAYFNAANPIGIHQGDNTATQVAQPTYANSSIFVQKATDPVWFITAAESYFLQSEAVLRYGVGAAGADKTNFDLGVNAAFAEYGLTKPATAAFIYPSGTFQQNLTAIITQKWVSLVGGSHSIEAFFDQERTGIPKISPVYSTNAKYLSDPGYTSGVFPNSHAGEWVYSNTGVTAGQFPKRLVFTDSERSRNKNTPTEVPITTKVWWGL